MKVVQLRTGLGIAARVDRAEPAPESEAAESGDDFDSTDAPLKRRRRRWRRPTPAQVIARALDGRGHRTAPDPVTIVARALERPAAPQQDGFWDVWLDHSDYLRAHALRYSGGNMADAEDALSEAMLKAANAFARTAIRNERGWLLRLVHNACMDRHRSNRRQNRLASDIGDGEAQSAPAIAIQPERSPEDLFAAMQQVSGIQQALGALPRFLAEPLLLHLDDQSDAEIALCLNVTKEVVRKRRQMARTLLKRMMRY